MDIKSIDKISGLSKFLVQNKLVALSDIQKHLDDANKKKMPIISYLVANKLMDARQFASLASTAFGLPLLRPECNGH